MFGLAGCTTTSTSTTGPTHVPTATIQFASSGSYSCVTGSCSSLVWTATNAGPDCAIDTTIVFRAFGSDGAPGAVQLGIDIPMGMQGGGSLSTYRWLPGVTITLVSLSGFNDVRSAHTVFRGFETHTDTYC
jgi:hypothetical protein